MWWIRGPEREQLGSLILGLRVHVLRDRTQVRTGQFSFISILLSSLVASQYAKRVEQYGLKPNPHGVFIMEAC
jgi:hypothetical protein